MDMQDLSVRDLDAVAGVAAHGHFGRAAGALRVAQPTLSAQVQKVERILGVRLFDRSGRRFLVTPEGQRVLPVVRDLLAGAERLRAAASEAGGATTALRLGIIPTLGPYLMPHLLVPSRSKGRAPALSISERLTSGLLTGLLEGTIDVALASLPAARHESLEFLPLFDEPFRLIAPRGSEILGVARLSPAGLCATDMVLLEEGHCLRDQALELCGKRRGGSPRLMTTSLETLKYVVAAGGGYSLLPQLASEIPAALKGLVEVRDFDERAPSRRVGLCFRRSWPRRGEGEALAEFVRGRLPREIHRL